LWQVSQVPVPTALAGECAKVTVSQLVVERWQPSQAVTPTCVVVLGLPTAGGKLPLWQVAHWVETVTLLCRRAGVHDAKPLRWQVSQLVMGVPVMSWYGMWLAERPSAGG
jgi:hypothetical protein